MNIYESVEDYLEAMLVLQEKHGYIRSIDIANHLGVTKPSVSYAVKRLREGGFLTMDENSFIKLTPEGMEIASKIYTREKVLTRFFIYLGVDEKTAKEDACKIEHDLSEESFAALKSHVESLK